MTQGGRGRLERARPHSLAIAARVAVIALALGATGIVGTFLGGDGPLGSGAPSAIQPTESPARDEGHKGGSPGPAATDAVPPASLEGSTPRQPRLPLGTLRPASLPPKADCPVGMVCSGFVVSCPGVREEAAGLIAIGTTRGLADGVAAFFSGLGGQLWWTEKEAAAEAFLNELRDGGLTVVQVRWVAPWLFASPGERAGPARLACRPATVIDWIHRTVPFSSEGPGPCGFCVTGTSGGSSQISYALSRYGLEREIDVVVPTSGPPHAAIADGCEGSGSSISYGSRTSVLDASLGFFKNGPCRAGDVEWAARWRRESVESGDLFYPDTAVRFVFGALDATRAAHHGVRYYLALRERGSPHVTAWVIPCMAHRVQAWPAGLDTLRVALTEPVVPEPVASPLSDGDCNVPTPDKTFSIPSVPGSEVQP